ncbi:hypothetical protein JCM13591A_07990 [Microbacterium xylanilyticum]
MYEARLDGAPVSDSVLDPGWNAYEWRLPFQNWDVTDAVRGGAGELAIDVLVGNGWYRGDLGFEGANANYGEEIALALVLELVFHDGSVQTVTTGHEWRAETSEVLRNSLYNGETIDARLRGEPGEEVAVSTVDVDRSRLVAQAGPPVRRQETLRPVRIWTSPAGRTLVDFGQNLVGWIRATVQGPRGTEIVLRHAEVLESGELGTRPLRAAQATDVFVLSGDEDVFEPTLTFHGFRYAEVTGWPGKLSAEDLEAVVVHSEMRRLGSFECSEPLVNQLVNNSVWGQKGNFLSVPTDCPQRDERLGWTGDIAAYAASASFQFDTSDFLHDWLEDLHAETRHSEAGVVPIVVPDVLKYAHFGEDFAFPALGATAIWGDAAVWAPEALWRAYGDRDRLAAHYPAMVLHLESVERALSPTGLWDQGFQFGDWLDPDAPPENPAAAKADPHVVATACVPLPLGVVRGGGRGGPRADRRGGALAAAGRADARSVPGALRRGRSRALGLRDRLRTGDLLRSSRRRRSREGGRAAGRAGARRGLSGHDRLRRHSVRHVGALRDGPRRGRLSAAAREGEPVLALSRDDGGDHGVGALGLDAPRRIHQPGRDDELQPLRARRGRGLDPPGRRRHPSGGARLRHGARRAGSRAGDHLGPHPVRDRGGRDHRRLAHRR